MAEQSNPTPARSSSALSLSSPFKALQEEMDRIFHAFSMPQMNWSSALTPTNGSLGLRVDIAETDDEIQVKADLPGIPEADVKVELEDDLLKIHAEKKAEEEKSGKHWRVVERSYGSFERTIRVPAGIDPDKTKAKFENGVLTVTLPKPPEASSKAHRIAVKTTA